jgi:hypothetical protein
MMVNLLHAIILNADLYDEGMTFDEASDGDYVVHAIYDLEGEGCIFHDDNIHNDPYKFLEGVEEGVKLTGANLDIDEVVVFLNEDENEYNFIDVCHAIRRWIEENLD